MLFGAESPPLPELDEPWVLRMRASAERLFWLGGLIAFVSLAGWLLGSRLLTAGSTTLPPIKFNGALLLLALACAGWRQNRLRRPCRSCDLLYAFVTILSGATAFQFFSGVNLGVDRLFWHGSLPVDALGGRVPVIPSLCMLVFALGGAGLFRPRFRAFSQALLLLGQVSILIFLIVFVFGFTTDASLPEFGKMSPFGTFALSAIGFASLLSDPSFGAFRGMATPFLGSWIFRQFFLLSAVVILGVSWVINRGALLGYYDLNLALCFRLTATLSLLYAALAKWSEWVNQTDRDRLLALQRLGESELQTRTIIESMPVMMWVVDSDGNLLFANRQWREYTGLRVEENFSGWQEKALHPDDWSVIRELRASSLRDQKPLEIEYRIRRASDGAYRHHLCVGTALRRLDGKVTHWLATGVDTEDQRNLNAQRTELRYREAATLESARLKNEFIANVSHEIRTPLHGVVGMAEALENTSLNSEQARIVAVLKSSANSLGLIVNDVLDLAKIEEGKMELEAISFSLDELLGELLTSFEISAAKKGLAFRFEIGDVPTWVQGDPLRIRQVLSNLLSNAIRFTEKGNVRLVVESTPAGAGAHLKFRVIDTGIGIPKEASSRLFQPFSQVDASTTRRFGGTGLGLRICRQIVELMKGRIGFESELGKGSEFWFELTLASAKPVQRGGPELRLARRARILVAEDHELNQAVMAHMLKALGCDVECVADGRAALDAITSGTYDLLFLDCQMPLMDGYEAATRIRDAGSHVPIVALTASAVAGDRERCLAVGMSDYLSKPVRSGRVEAVLRRWLADDGLPPELRELCSSPGGVSAARELVQLYQSRTPERLERMRSALAAADAGALAKEAHALKSASGYIGAREISRLCREIEAEAGQGQLGAAGEKLEAMRSEFDSFRIRLNELP